MWQQVLYLCFGTVVGVEVPFMDWRAFWLESEYLLLGLVLGANLGFNSGVADTG